MYGLSKLGTMDQTRVGVDTLLPVVVRRLWQVPAPCIKCGPVRVLGTHVARKAFLPLKIEAKPEKREVVLGEAVVRQKPPPSRTPFQIHPFQPHPPSQHSDNPYPNNTLSPLPRADSREEVCCLDPIHEQRPLLPNLFRHFAPAEAHLALPVGKFPAVENMCRRLLAAARACHQGVHMSEPPVVSCEVAVA